MRTPPEPIMECVTAFHHLGTVLGFPAEDIALKFWEEDSAVGISWKNLNERVALKLGYLGTYTQAEFEERFNKALESWYAGEIQPWKALYKQSYAYKNRRMIQNKMREAGLPAVGVWKTN